MTLPVQPVVTAILEEKWFQMLLTLVVIVGYIVLAALNNPEAAETFKGFSLISFGYWFGQLGSGIAVANRVQAEVVKNG